MQQMFAVKQSDYRIHHTEVLKKQWNEISGGQCFGASYYWITRQFSRMPAQPSEYRVPDGKAWGKSATIHTVFENKVGDADSPDVYLKKIARKNGLHSENYGYMPLALIDEVLKYTESVAIFLNYHYTGVKGATAHAMALFYNPQQNYCHFFDPNHGQYRGTKGGIRLSVERHLHENYNKIGKAYMSVLTSVNH